MVVGRWAAFGLVGGQAAAVDGNTIEDARQIVHDLFHTEKFAVSRRKRDKMEMPFAHLKRRPGFTHLRLRGLRGASDEFILATTMQNLKCLSKLAPACGPRDPFGLRHETAEKFSASAD